MSNHFISTPIKKVEPKKEVDAFKFTLGEVQSSFGTANVALQNIDMLMKNYDPEKGHSTTKFKSIINNFSKNFRCALRDTNINMMKMDDMLSQIGGQL